MDLFLITFETRCDSQILINYRGFEYSNAVVLNLEYVINLKGYSKSLRFFMKMLLNAFYHLTKGYVSFLFLV